MDSDFLKEFSDFDSETSQPAEKISKEQTEADHKLFMSMATKDKPIDHLCWGVEILKTLTLASRNRHVEIRAKYDRRQNLLLLEIK